MVKQNDAEMMRLKQTKQTASPTESMKDNDSKGIQRIGTHQNKKKLAENWLIKVVTFFSSRPLYPELPDKFDAYIPVS